MVVELTGRAAAASHRARLLWFEGGDMALPALTPLDWRIGQILIAIATAVLIGHHFLPPRYRPIVGWTMTVCYVVCATALVIFVFYR